MPRAAMLRAVAVRSLKESAVADDGDGDRAVDRARAAEFSAALRTANTDDAQTTTSFTEVEAAAKAALDGAPADESKGDVRVLSVAEVAVWAPTSKDMWAANNCTVAYNRNTSPAPGTAVLSSAHRVIYSTDNYSMTAVQAGSRPTDSGTGFVHSPSMPAEGPALHGFWTLDGNGFTDEHRAEKISLSAEDLLSMLLLQDPADGARSGVNRDCRWSSDGKTVLFMRCNLTLKDAGNELQLLGKLPDSVQTKLRQSVAFAAASTVLVQVYCRWGDLVKAIDWHADSISAALGERLVNTLLATVLSAAGAAEILRQVKVAVEAAGKGSQFCKSQMKGISASNANCLKAVARGKLWAMVKELGAAQPTLSKAEVMRAAIVGHHTFTGDYTRISAI